MSSIIHYNSCPVCKGNNLQAVLIVKDFTVSAEMYSVVQCNNCTLRFTQDVPDAVAIAPYYQSENYISHTDTSKGLINRLYKSVRKKTLHSKANLISKTTGLRTGNFLDVGSGTGAFVHTMKEKGWEVFGLEPDEAARAIAKKLYNIDLADISRFNQLPENSFDAITLWHVLEHVHDLHPYIQQLKTLLKADGRLFVAVPNYTSKDASIYKEYWAAYDVPRHLYHFSPQSMEKLLLENGMRLIDCKPMWYDSFYISMLSSKYKHGKSNLVTSFINGLRSNFTAMRDVRKCSSVIYIIGK